MNLFGNFGVDASSNLAVDLVPSLIMSSLFNLATLSWLLQDDFLTIIGDTLFPFGRDVPPYHPSSTSCPLLPLFLPLGNFITSEHPDHPPSAGRLLLCLLSFPGNFTTSDHLSSPGYPLFFPFMPLGNSILDHLPSPSLFCLLPFFCNSIYNWWTSCNTCLSSIISAKSWCWEICHLSEIGFLDDKFLLKNMKHLLLYIYDNRLYLLASKFYMVNALLANLRSWMDLP